MRLVPLGPNFFCNAYLSSLTSFMCPRNTLTKDNKFQAYIVPGWDIWEFLLCPPISSVNEPILHWMFSIRPLKIVMNDWLERGIPISRLIAWECVPGSTLNWLAYTEKYFSHIILKYISYVNGKAHTTIILYFSKFQCIKTETEDHILHLGTVYLNSRVKKSPYHNLVQVKITDILGDSIPYVGPLGHCSDVVSS